MAVVALWIRLRVDHDGELYAETQTDVELGAGVIQAPRATDRRHGFAERAFRRRYFTAREPF